MIEEPIEPLNEAPPPESPPESEIGYKRPRSVLVVVYTWRGEFLLLRRTQPTGFWQSVTGSLRARETPPNAALRELYEETGLRAGGALEDLRHQVRFPILPAWRSRYEPGVRENREHWFALGLPSHRLIRLNVEEHRECRWVGIERALSLASSTTNRNAIRLVYGALLGAQWRAVC